VLEKIDAVDELHREEPLLGLREQLVQGHKIGMGDVGERPELLLEPVQRVRLGAPQGLQRDDARALAVVRAIHNPEPAGA
jgi:hypothetical protein